MRAITFLTLLVVACAAEPKSPKPPAGGSGGDSGSGGSASGGSGGRGADAAPSSPADAAGPDLGPPPMAVDTYGSLPNGGGIRESALAFEDRLYQYEVTVAQADWDNLNKNAIKFDDTGTYVPATVKIDGKDYGKVGFRYKGSYGNFRTCFKDLATANPVDPSTLNPGFCPMPPKWQYKIAFNEFVPATTYFGLHKINLHGMMRDPSKLREKLAYKLFRDMNIPTARSTHARLTINGEYKGIYSVVENMSDGRFTKDHWPSDGQGNLYKQAWPISAVPSYYSSRLETNTMAAPPASHDKVIAFAKDVIAAAANPQQEFGVLMKWSDPEWLARYMAVDTLSRNADGITKFSCNPAMVKECLPNNFFFYQTMGDKFLLLPWDLDYTFNIVVDHDILPPWDRAIADCNQRFMLYGSPHMAASCNPILKAVNSMRPLYINAMKQLLEKYDVPRLQADIDRWASYVKDGIVGDPAVMMGPWMNDLMILKLTVNALKVKGQKVVDGMDFR